MSNNKIRYNDRTLKTIHAQYLKAIKEPNEYVKFFREDNDPGVIYILVHNLRGDKDEFVGGEYLFRMILPENFPHEPPHFYAMSENGVYDMEKKVCISIGEYHKRDYPAAMGIRGFALELANGIMCWNHLGHGINILNTSVEEKRQIAKRSRDEIMKRHPDILAAIEASFNEYSAEWGKK